MHHMRCLSYQHAVDVREPQECTLLLCMRLPHRATAHAYNGPMPYNALFE